MMKRLVIWAAIGVLASCSSSTGGGDTGVDTGATAACPPRSDIQGMTCDPTVNNQTCAWSCLAEQRPGGYDRTGVCDSTSHWRIFDDTSTTQCAAVAQDR